MGGRSAWSRGGYEAFGAEICVLPQNPQLNISFSPFCSQQVPACPAQGLKLLENSKFLPRPISASLRTPSLYLAAFLEPSSTHRKAWGELVRLCSEHTGQVWYPAQSRAEWWGWMESCRSCPFPGNGGAWEKEQEKSRKVWVLYSQWLSSLRNKLDLKFYVRSLNFAI